MPAHPSQALVIANLLLVASMLGVRCDTTVPQFTCTSVGKFESVRSEFCPKLLSTIVFIASVVARFSLGVARSHVVLSWDLVFSSDGRCLGSVCVGLDSLATSVIVAFASPLCMPKAQALGCRRRQTDGECPRALPLRGAQV